MGDPAGMQPGFGRLNAWRRNLVQHRRGLFLRGGSLAVGIALAIGEKALEPDHPFLTASLENYAALPRETGREDKVEEMEVRAHAIQAKHAQQNPVQ
jgi:hypothetical protein